MTWEIIKHKDGKVMIPVTMDEFVGMLPPEVDELIEDHNTNVVPYNDFMEKIDMNEFYSEKHICTFNIDPKNITFREV